jgi:hypothetical protein
MPVLHIFFYLQILDFLTTMAGFRAGAIGASPFIVKLMHASSPAMGIVGSKAIGLTIVGLCIALNKKRLVGWMNYWYAGLVVWNLCMILTVGSRVAH